MLKNKKKHKWEPKPDISVSLCVTALQDIMQLHLTTERVVGLFLSSQHFTLDHYETKAVQTRLESTFHPMTDHHIHIHDIHRHVRVHATILLIFMSDWRWQKPPALVHENHELTRSVCARHRQTTNKAPLSFCRSMSLCPLPAFQTDLQPGKIRACTPWISHHQIVLSDSVLVLIYRRHLRSPWQPHPPYATSQRLFGLMKQNATSLDHMEQDREISFAWELWFYTKYLHPTTMS